MTKTNDSIIERRSYRLVVLLAVFVLIVAACTSSSDDTTTTSAAAEGGGGESTAQYTIGAMLWDTSIPFYSNFIKGQEDAAKALNVDLQLRSGQGDLAEQIAVVQQFIAEGVDLIIATPSDAEGIVPVLNEAAAAGIPVITANNAAGKEAQIVTFVGANDYEFGRKQGEMLVQAIGESGKVGLIMGALGTSAQILREEGLRAYIADYPGIEIVDTQSANWASEEALAITQDWMNKYGEGELDAIIDQGPEGVAAATAVNEAGRTDITFLLGDYPADVKTAIEDGIVYGTVDQDPYPQGFQAVTQAVVWLSGNEGAVPAPSFFLPLPIVTADNVADFPPAWGG